MRDPREGLPIQSVRLGKVAPQRAHKSPLTLSMRSSMRSPRPASSASASHAQV
jgi:hypothetical protein